MKTILFVSFTMEILSRQHGFQTLIESIAQQSYRLRVGDLATVLVLGAISLFYLGDGKFWGKPDPNAYLWYVAPQKSGDLTVRPKRTRDIGGGLRVTVMSSSVGR